MMDVKDVYTDSFQEITQVRLMRPSCLGGNLDVSAERIDMTSNGYAYVYVARELEMSVGSVIGWAKIRRAAPPGKSKYENETNTRTSDERGRIAPCQNL